MKVFQSKLAVGTEGKVLVDATNVKLTTNVKNKKRKSENAENLKPVKFKRKDGIYTDPPTSAKKTVDSGIQTEPISHVNEDADQKIVEKIEDMLTSDNAPPEYWQSLAEKRRQALEITLEENRVLKEENENLKGEIKLLEEMIEEAKELASLVQEITSTESSERSEPKS